MVQPALKIVNGGKKVMKWLYTYEWSNLPYTNVAADSVVNGFYTYEWSNVSYTNVAADSVVNGFNSVTGWLSDQTKRLKQEGEETERYDLNRYMISVNLFKEACNRGQNIIDGILASRITDSFEIMTENLRTTAFGIKTAVDNSWVFRIDNPHKNANYPHINISYKFTGIRDPHVHIPEFLVSLSSELTHLAKIANENALYVAIAVHTYQTGLAVSEDVKDMKSGEKTLPKQTVATMSSILGGYGGAAVGAKSGSCLGGLIGFGLGLPLGVVGSVPLQAVGSVVGGIFGGINGAWYGRKCAREFAETQMDSLEMKVQGQQQERDLPGGSL